MIIRLLILLMFLIGTLNRVIAEPIDAIYQLDRSMRDDFTPTQKMVGFNASPTIIVQFSPDGGIYTLRRNQQNTTVHPVPELYAILRSISHTSVGLFEIVYPAFSKKAQKTWLSKLNEYNKELKLALKAIDVINIPIQAKKTSREILMAGIYFSNKVLKNSVVTQQDFIAYSTPIRSAINYQVQLASKIQVDSIEALLQKWQKEMGKEEWKRLYAVVNYTWGLRRENVHFQILAQQMGREAVNDRLVLVESIELASVDQLLMQLGFVINNRNLAMSVFGSKNKFKMDVELMGAGARKEIEKNSTIKHPAIDMKWLPYEEHKMPNEE